MINLKDAERILKIRREDLEKAEHTYFKTFEDEDFRIVSNLEDEIELLKNVISHFEINKKSKPKKDIKVFDKVVITKILPINHSSIPEHYKCLEVGDVGIVLEAFKNSISVSVEGKINVKSKKDLFRLDVKGLELVKGRRKKESKIINEQEKNFLSVYQEVVSIKKVSGGGCQGASLRIKTKERTVIVYLDLLKQEFDGLEWGIDYPSEILGL